MKNTNVKTIEGLANIKKYYYSINDLLDKNEEVLVFGARSGNPDFQEAIDFFINYIHDRSSKGIKTKILYNIDVQTLGKTYEQIDLVQVRYMPLGLVTKIGINVYRNTVDMLDWSDPLNPKVIVIKDRHIAESHREYFNLMWSSTVALAELEKKGNYYLPEILFENFINHSDENEKVEQSLIKILNERKPKTILNVGAGLDTLTQHEDFPNSVEHITIVEKNTSYAHSYNDSKIEVIHSSFENWNNTKTYDFILLSHVLFYIPNKETVIKKILSYLENGGCAVFVLNKPSADYKKIKDFIFGFQGKKYVYTYDKLSQTLSNLDIEPHLLDIECTLETRDSYELYKAMRLWFEMDLNTYYEKENEIIKLFPTSRVSYTNTVFVIEKNH